MRTTFLLSMLLYCMTSPAIATPPLPNTPAAHVFRGWLDAFNSGDAAREEAYLKTYYPALDPQSMAKWRAETGPYELLEVVSKDKTNIFFRVRAQSNGAEEVGRLRVNDSEPATVQELITFHIPTATPFDVVVLDNVSRHQIVEKVAHLFDVFYVLPETGKNIAAELQAREKRNDYRSIRYGMDLARQLTHDVQDISHDKHAEVGFSFFARPAESFTQKPQPNLARLIRVNCGFTKAEHLRPNIGYIKLDGLEDASICAPTASAAMAFVAQSDALIIDLRENHGGGGGMAEFVASYLFADPVHLDDSVERGAIKKEESWTVANVPGKKFLDKPVFLLTSRQTFSAAEALSYGLKALKRVTLVGESTGGGAHMIEMKPIDEHFFARVPASQSINPITQTNWEGTGVEPDVKVPADQALDVALKLAAAESGVPK